MADTDLLRSDVSGQLRIIRCEITVDVLRDLDHAEYCFYYLLKRTAPGPNYWREVFAYPTTDFAMVGSAQPGKPSGENRGHDGLRHKVTPLGDQEQSSCLVIDFDREVPVGADYEFHYRCKTRVESAQSRSVLGRTGAVWYWCAHEFPVQSISVAMRLPPGSRVIATHPYARIEPHERGGSVKRIAKATFERNALVPSEFVVALVTNETRRLWLPLRHARAFELVGAILIGVLGSLLAEWILRLGG